MSLCFPSHASNQRDPVIKRRQTILVLALLAGMGGCKRQEAAPRKDSQTEVKTSSQKKDAAPEDSKPKSIPASTQSATVAAPASPASPDSSDAAPKADVAGSDTGAPALPPESASSASLRKPSAQDAIKSAKNFRQAATTYAEQGKLEPAFKAAVQGWQLLRTHQTDPNCKRLAAELVDDIKNYSDQLAKAAGGEAGMPDDSKPIRFE